MDPQYLKIKHKIITPSSTEIIGTVRRSDFEDEFMFGSATAAYQVEGATKIDGRGPSIWDAWTHLKPKKVDDGSTGDVAVDQYHKYKEDVQLMKKTGLESYRFSISWSRILPGGKLNAGINQKGIQYYNNLIDELIAADITPCATLFHWDLPNALQLQYGGWLSRDIVQDFVDYAELCFWEFGDRVKHWITLNEPWSFTTEGYVRGTFPPGRGIPQDQQRPQYKLCGHKSHKDNSKPAKHGSAATEPYEVAHNLILAHASAVQMYRTSFQENQGGKIGITNLSHFFEPYYDTDEDRDACIRALDWMYGWFTAPVTTGDYPPNMRKSVGRRLPEFTPAQKRIVKGSYDFIGMNYYTTYYATNTPRQPHDPVNFLTDQQLTTKTARDGVNIGDPSGATWLFLVPRGIYNLLVYTKEIYGVELIYITENGVAEKLKPHRPFTKARKDPLRVRYYREHLWYVKKAITEANVNVQAYYLWSLVDNFEWAQGYTSRFGTFLVDYTNGELTRYPKTSAIWWRNFFNNKSTVHASLKREAIKDAESDKDSRKKTRASK